MTGPLKEHTLKSGEWLLYSQSDTQWKCPRSAAEGERWEGALVRGLPRKAMWGWQVTWASENNLASAMKTC